MNDAVERSFWKHRMGKFAIFIVALFTLWFGGWFVIANFADGKIDNVLTQLRDRGTALECAEKQIKGFPFRMGVNCAEVRFGGTRTGVAMKTGALRTTSILYDPTEMISELDSPARLWFGGPEVILNWDLMRLYSNVTTAGALELLSLNFTKLRANESEADIRAKSGALHARPTPDTPADLDVALNLKEFQAFAPRGGMIDPTDLSLDIRLAKGHNLLVEQRQPLRQILGNGVAGEIRSIKMAVGDGGVLVARGPLSLDEFGFISGELEIGVSNPGALKTWAQTINPNVSNGVGLIAQAVAGMGKKVEISGEQVQSITITIEEGRARLGFIEFGKIPPLDF